MSNKVKHTYIHTYTHTHTHLRAEHPWIAGGAGDRLIGRKAKKCGVANDRPFVRIKLRSNSLIWMYVTKYFRTKE